VRGKIVRNRSMVLRVLSLHTSHYTDCAVPAASRRETVGISSYAR